MGLIGLIIFIVFAAWFLIFVVLGLTFIGANEVGHVSKWWSFKGALKRGLIALEGEAGYQPEVLRAGAHLRTRLMFRVTKSNLVTVAPDKIGYIFARDGASLDAGQVLGKVVPESSNFQDIRVF
jgi:uncharacterized membrane protein YqiK